MSQALDARRAENARTGSRWRRRSRQFLSQPENALCTWCRAEGRTVASEVSHHEERWNRDRTKLFMGKLIPLCAHCHNTRAQQQERIGYFTDIGPDGLPLDRANHPFWVESAKWG